MGSSPKRNGFNPPESADFLSGQIPDVRGNRFLNRSDQGQQWLGICERSEGR